VQCRDHIINQLRIYDEKTSFIRAYGFRGYRYIERL